MTLFQNWQTAMHFSRHSSHLWHLSLVTAWNRFVRMFCWDGLCWAGVESIDDLRPLTPGSDGRVLSPTRQIDPPAAKFMTNSIKITKRLSEIKNDKNDNFHTFLPWMPGTHMGEVCVFISQIICLFFICSFFIGVTSILHHFSFLGKRVSPNDC